MLWIKRNLFVAIGGLIAVVLLGFGGYYLFSSYSRSKEFDAQLEQTRGELNNFFQQSPFPHSTNVTVLERETKRLRDAVTECRRYFQPILYTNVTGLEFKKLLDATIAALQEHAKEQNVRITNAVGRPHTFSFDAEKAALNFPSAAFPALPQQLAEVRTICSLLFQAKIYELAGVRRWRIQGYSESGAATDYHEVKVDTNAVVGASITPYEVEFVCYSQELASVLESFSKSGHGFSVKPQLIKPIVSQAQAAGAIGGPTIPQPIRPQPRPGTLQGPRPTAAQRDPLVTALDEQRFVVTLLVQIIKPSS